MRRWSNRGQDNGSIHCLGNGLVCAYGQGPELAQFFGPPYSSPSFFRLGIAAETPLESVSTREPGTAIWRHTITAGGNAAAVFTDGIPPDLPCLTRTMDCAMELTLSLRFEPHVAVVENSVRFGGQGVALLACMEAGASIYGNYPTKTRQYLQVVFTGQAVCRQTAPNEYVLSIHAGRSAAYFCAGSRYPDAVLTAEQALRDGPESLLEATRRWWLDFTGRRKNFDALLPAALPHRERLLELIDSVSVLIRAQQGREGAVLAGHNYHLGYVRDQYGMSRCLLALGYHGEARAVLSFYWGVWQKHGLLHNAQGIGADVFHIHENDDVEITGYLILQAFDYLRETGDEEFLLLIWPMLLWAFDAQQRHLAGGMLPFNGDETYIAGGVLPRDAIHDGSAEATMLFITGGRMLLDWAGRHGLMAGGALRDGLLAVAEAERLFPANFMPGGRLITNNPDRQALAVPPRFRHGVCQGCGAFGWTERASGGLYACPTCLQGVLRHAEQEVYDLKSVGLMPRYIGSDAVDGAAQAAYAAAIAGEYETTGRLPSSPDGDCTVGYDYGLLLYNLAHAGHPAAGQVYARMLDAADDTDAWVEYYRCGQPSGTRCRPWESGINLHGALEFAKEWQGWNET